MVTGSCCVSPHAALPRACIRVLVHMDFISLRSFSSTKQYLCKQKVSRSYEGGQRRATSLSESWDDSAIS